MGFLPLGKWRPIYGLGQLVSLLKINSICLLLKIVTDMNFYSRMEMNIYCFSLWAGTLAPFSKQIVLSFPSPLDTPNGTCRSLQG